MKTLFSLLFVWIGCTLLSGQPVSPFFSGPFSLGHATIRSGHDGPQSLFNNPASMMHHTVSGIYLGMENRFELAALSSAQLAGTMNLGKYGMLGAKMIRFGSEEYIDQTFGLAYARRLSHSILLGVSFDLLHLRIPEYGSRSLFTFELGMISRITQDIRINVYVFSPQGMLFVESHILPTVMSIGVDWSVSDRVSLLAEVEKSSYHPSQIKVSVGYRLLDNLSLSAGVISSSHSANMTGGMQFTLREHWQMHLGVALHQYLGISSGIGFEYHF